MMEAVNSIPVIEDIKGEPGTNAGGMLEKGSSGHVKSYKPASKRY